MIVIWRGQKVYVAGWEPNAPECCELCQKKDKLRPFGPDGKFICLECANKNPLQTKKAMEAVTMDADFVFTLGAEIVSEESEILELLDLVAEMKRKSLN